MAQTKIKLEKVVSGITHPLAMVQPPGDGRMFVNDQTGRVRIIENGKVNPTPFLDVRSKIVTLMADFDERGLLGLAFHPKFKENGKFYVAYSAHLDYQADLGQMLWYNHSNVVEEYAISSKDKNTLDPSTARRSPGRTESVTSEIAASAPKSFVTPRSSSIRSTRETILS